MPLHHHGHRSEASIHSGQWIKWTLKLRGAPHFLCSLVASGSSRLCPLPVGPSHFLLITHIPCCAYPTPSLWPHSLKVLCSPINHCFFCRSPCQGQIQAGRAGGGFITWPLQGLIGIL